MKSIAKIIAYSTLAATILASCSKKDVDDIKGTTTNPTSNVTKTESQLLLDSIFLYAKQTYYWNTMLPDSATFLPESFLKSTTNLTNATSEIFALTRYAINPSTGKSYEYYDYYGDTTSTKYSYIQDDDADLNDDQSSITTEGWGNDLGFYINSGNYYDVLYPKVVFNNSPAEKAGLKRGDLIWKINGSEFDLRKSADVTTINNAMNASSITLTILDSNSTTGPQHTITLTKARYSSSPIIKDTVWTINNQKIGYLAFLNFASPDVAESKLNTLFSDYASKGIEDLIVDLRYNGGGYVSTSQQLADLIAPASQKGSTMFIEHYNDMMRNKQATILKNLPLDDNPGYTYYDVDYSDAQNTKKFGEISTGQLTLKNVCFIVSGGTASASELLINNLKPVFSNMQIIGAATDANTDGTPATTNSYGKPVGFFPIHMYTYDMWMPNFISYNSLKDSVPYAGFTPNMSDWDDLTHDFGNPLEDATAQAISYLTKGSYLTTNTTIGAKSAIDTKGNEIRLNGFSLTNLMSIERGGYTRQVSGFQTKTPGQIYKKQNVNRAVMIENRYNLDR